MSKTPPDGQPSYQTPSGTWVTRFHNRPATEDNINNAVAIIDTIETTKSSTSPVVLVAGPGPDGKPVIKPPEGTWIIINPRLAGLRWLLKIDENKLVAELKRIMKIEQ